MVAYGYPYQTQPFVPLGVGTQGATPIGYGTPQVAPAGLPGLASGAWYAFFIILFIVIILFWGVWAFSGYYY